MKPLHHARANAAGRPDRAAAFTDGQFDQRAEDQVAEDQWPPYTAIRQTAEYPSIDRLQSCVLNVLESIRSLLPTPLTPKLRIHSSYKVAYLPPFLFFSA